VADAGRRFPPPPGRPRAPAKARAAAAVRGRTADDRDSVVGLKSYRRGRATTTGHAYELGTLTTSALPPETRDCAHFGRVPSIDTQRLAGAPQDPGAESVTTICRCFQSVAAANTVAAASLSAAARGARCTSGRAATVRRPSRNDGRTRLRCGSRTSARAVLRARRVALQRVWVGAAVRRSLQAGRLRRVAGRRGAGRVAPGQAGRRAASPHGPRPPDRHSPRLAARPRQRANALLSMPCEKDDGRAPSAHRRRDR
jgi:hypothetical protein